MHHIGFHYNYSFETNRRKRRSPSLLNRVALVDAQLRPAGYRIFLHSPRDIEAGSTTVRGCVFDGQTFTPVRAEVPPVNGNWTHRTRRLLDKEGMGYQNFGRWAHERGIGIYVPHAFSELIGNKLETYKLVRGFHETLHPHCEPYAHSERQLEHFVDTGRVTFIKPRAGSKGDRIITLRRESQGLMVTRYFKGRRRTVRAADLRAVRDIVREVTAGERKYLIQHGVETLRHEGRTFDIRVTMLHDGDRWHWLDEARLSPAGSDVSNLGQGGEIAVTEHLLFEVLGPESSRELMYELESESFGLAAYLEQLHPGEIHEVAFDFAVDREGRLRLLEINTKPGLAGIGSNISVFDRSPEHEPWFERWVYPHARYLSRFLLRKAMQHQSA